jgi:hypothetical protein
MVLEPVYEQDFLDCSYGFRPGRSAHQAVQALWDGLMDLRGGWVIDLDIRASMVRYADDALLAFEREDDARRVLAVLPKRFERFGLTLHPEKTRLVDFRRPAWRGPNRSQRERRFDLLGFTHDWGRSQKGNWVVKRKTARSRFSRAVRQIGQWCRHHRHLTVAEQQQALSQKLRGHDAYYGITGNARALVRFRQEVQRRWRKWLNRRSHKAFLDWAAFTRLLQRYPLPPPRVVHSIYAT